MIKKNILFLLLFYGFSINSQTTVKTMFYNLLNYNSDFNSQNRTPYLKTILEDIQPDLFMVCELKNETASNYLFNNAVLTYNSKFKKADFNYSNSPATGLLQMVYFNSDKLTLEKSTIVPTTTRDINHYTFKLNTENSETTPINIEVFVTHLKASSGYTNRQKRLSSIREFTTYLDQLDPNSFVLFAGDFNFYTSNEEGFTALIDEYNSIQIVDPINRLCPEFPNDDKDYFDDDYNSTYFWNNSSFADVHSQATRNYQLNGDGAGGGMDDRFDFIMMSKNLTTSSDLYYVDNSYKTIGNNGNCYNSYVSNTNCTGAFTQELRNALYNFSDHLPIVMEVETSENVLLIPNILPVSFINTNIVKNEITLALKENVNSIIIYNQLGQIMYQTKNINQQELTIDIRHFSKGIYYLKTDAYKTLKFVKN
ncbi:T9SS type A sorting domain-containing protein [Polaribacter sp. Asnod6-C07]|uniref:T9SS type A sorting domain-containing protein n=1 Tax=Polaribacter sp. Asnod6-C07 TaxID=3160582 RepID=UPI003865088B